MNTNNSLWRKRQIANKVENMIHETRITELALEAGLLNYVDNETPRRYFINGHADLEEVEKFAQLIVCKCAEIAETAEPYQSQDNILRYFGVK